MTKYGFGESILSVPAQKRLYDLIDYLIRYFEISPDSAVSYLARFNDNKAVYTYLNKYPDIGLNTILRGAAAGKNFELIDYLVEKGADINEIWGLYEDVTFYIRQKYPHLIV